ncbi:MAG: PDZ domain-containing protein, partial [Acidobacteria bacterium]|nr:PDZ domain-containing protein [Acidobacteriota bacterium]
VPVTVRARTVAAVQSRPSAAGDASLGLIMRAAVGTGTEVTRVLDGSAAAQAGLRSGDEIVRIGKTAAPTAADVSAAFAQTRPGAVLFLSVRRDRQPLLVALRR